jgi:receptor protein-tyrosine kinase
LGIVFAQLGKRTLLIDADLENPCLHVLFNLRNVVGLSTVLSKRGVAGSIQRAPGQMDLFVLTAGPQPPNPHELVSREQFYALLDQVRPAFDIVLIDTTAFSEGAEAQAIAARTGGALLVVRQGTTTNAGFSDLLGAMQSARASVVGAVMNRF